MSVSITIRDVPDETRDALAARAARSGRSLQEYLSLELRELASKPSAAEALADARLRARQYPPVDTADLLRALGADRK